MGWGILWSFMVSEAHVFSFSLFVLEHFPNYVRKSLAYSHLGGYGVTWMEEYIFSMNAGMPKATAMEKGRASSLKVSHREAIFLIGNKII